MSSEIEIFEKVNPMHPDKIADRIAGALVDLAYKKDDNPKCAIEVLIGHGECNILGECSVSYYLKEVEDIVERITNNSIKKINLKITKQDKFLANNQKDKVKCGDNGIFRAMLPTYTERAFTELMYNIYKKYSTDGKGLITRYYNEDKELMTKIIICQSQASNSEIEDIIYDWANMQGTYLMEDKHFKIEINPLGYWLGGLEVDSGATNRKLGSDMGRGVTGGGLNGKEYSKADLTINTFLYLRACRNKLLGLSSYCAIGDDVISITDFDDGNTYTVDYGYMVEVVKKYIKRLGGFEKFAEWGLIRPRQERLNILEEKQDYEEEEDNEEANSNEDYF